jgi:transcriptional regulator with XRE-family HTH domain
MSRQSYILIEAGKKKATVHQLYLIANALKIKIDKILLPLDNALKILRPDIEKFDNLTKKWFNKKEMDEIIETISEKEE